MSLFQRVLVPTDFSEGAGQALEHAIALALEFGSSLVLVHVIAIPMMYGLDGPILLPLWNEARVRTQIDEALTVMVAETRDRGVADVSSAVLSGSAWKEITALAAEQGCDLIVMGTHGRGGVEHLVLGSVTEKVIRHAASPVLAVGPHRSGSSLVGDAEPGEDRLDRGRIVA